MTLLLVLVLGSAVFAGSVVQHTVQPGESVTTIARKYRVSTSQILSENSIANADLLRVGQVLSVTLPDDTPVPAPTSTPVPTSPPTQTPVPSESPDPPDPPDPPVAPTAEEQEAVQPAKVATAVPATPTATPQTASSGCLVYYQNGDLRYTIRSGDSLYELANRYRISVGAIKSRNCMTSDVVLVGQSIIIPIGAVLAEATPAPTATPRSASTSPATVTPTPWPTSTPVPKATPVPAPTADTRSWLDRLLNR